MKTKHIFIFLLIILISQSLSTAQTVELPKLLDEVQSVARKTAYKSWVEYNSDFKRIELKANGEKIVYAYEGFCSRKTCVAIPLSRNDKRFSEKKINKYRQQAAESLTKAESRPDYATYKDKENSLGYGISVYDWFNPSLYLRTCKSEFAGKSDINDRPTIKISVTGCNLESISKIANPKGLEFMTKTEALVWIDEQDKAIVKAEIYAKKEFPNLSKTNEPLVVIEAAKIPDGFWFWKSIKVNALDNKAVFPQYTSDWAYEFYNYRLSNVEVTTVEIDKKNDEKEK